MSASRERFTLRRALAVAQVALSLVLVAGALLFSRSLGKILSIDGGFRQEDVLTATAMFQRLNLPAERVPVFKESWSIAFARFPELTRQLSRILFRFVIGVAATPGSTARHTATQAHESQSRWSRLLQRRWRCPAVRTRFRWPRSRRRAARGDCEPGVRAQGYRRRQSGGPTVVDRGRPDRLTRPTRSSDRWRHEV